MTQAEQPSRTIAPGTPLQKVIPPRLVEPYLSGQRSVIAGFVYLAQDSAFSDPASYYDALALGYEGSEFTPDMPEIYILRWRAVGTETYRVPLSPARGGDWAMKPPFTGNGFTADQEHAVAEYYTEPVPVPVGAEIHRVTANGADFIARYDGQVWLRPAEGSELCVTG